MRHPSIGLIHTLAPHSQPFKTNHKYNKTKHSHLKYTTVFVKDKPITLLFDDGAEVNIISTKLAMRFKKHIHTLHKPWGIKFPNNIKIEIKESIFQLPFTIPALHNNKQQTQLHFTTNFLIMDSSIDLLIGMPFLRYHHLISHYCQDTYIYTSNLGHRITIPLHSSKLHASNAFTNTALLIPQQQTNNHYLTNHPSSHHIAKNIPLYPNQKQPTYQNKQ